MAHVFEKEFKGKGVANETKEELIWDRRGEERVHGTRSTARLLIFPCNHPASLAHVRSGLAPVRQTGTSFGLIRAGAKPET